MAKSCRFAFTPDEERIELEPGEFHELPEFVKSRLKFEQHGAASQFIVGLAPGIKLLIPVEDAKLHPRSLIAVLDREKTRLALGLPPTM